MVGWGELASDNPILQTKLCLDDDLLHSHHGLWSTPAFILTSEHGSLVKNRDKSSLNGFGFYCSRTSQLSLWELIWNPHEDKMCMQVGSGVTTLVPTGSVIMWTTKFSATSRGAELVICKWQVSWHLKWEFCYLLHYTLDLMGLKFRWSVGIFSHFAFLQFVHQLKITVFR